MNEVGVGVLLPGGVLSNGRQQEEIKEISASREIMVGTKI
jgi:hypothetical protein